MNGTVSRRAALVAGAVAMAATVAAWSTAGSKDDAPPASAAALGVSVPRLSPVLHAHVDGMDMGYRTGGRGPALVMIIGRSATMAEWDPQLIRQLIGTHRVVVFDNRGVATSDNPSARALTIQQMARDTLGLMTALGIGRADVLGWSMGGMIAQQVAIDAPSRVLRLVLCATSPGGSHAAQPAGYVQKDLDSPDLSTATLFSLSFPPDRAGVHGALSYALRVATQPDLLPDSFTITPSARANQEAAGSAWKAPGGGDYDELPHLRVATLVLWGRLDVVNPPYNNWLIISRLPHVRYQVFGNAGHAFLFQDAVAVGTAIRDFLR
jgi:pimeloyl-ACP methyl ester carboxylesterase